MAKPSFDPADHPSLLGLARQLRDLAGDSAYQAGREYLRKGLVKDGSVAGTTGYATVTGSTDYRVSVAFGDGVKPSCTCPAHRRNKYCKHVVALCVALLERPADFPAVEPLPAVPSATTKRRPRRAGAADEVKAQTLAHREAGLAAVDRLASELAAGGLLGPGPEMADLLQGAGELVRALKLRRLANLIQALRPVARGEAAEAGEFARLLIDLHLTKSASAAFLAGQRTLDPRLADDLLGKTWREEELEATSALELIEVANTRDDDGEFRIESSFLVDIATATPFAEKQITPLRLHARPTSRHRLLLDVDEARLYPGPMPRRIRLVHAQRVPLTATKIDQLVSVATGDIAEVRRRLAEQLTNPFGSAEVAVVFRPTSIVVQGKQIGALDQRERFMTVDWPSDWTARAIPSLATPTRCALFGFASLGENGLDFRCLAILSARFDWGRGPVFPDV
jgi:hypothetical protein